MKQKTITVHMSWADVETSDNEDILEVGGTTPGGESVKVRVHLTTRSSIGYLGRTLHEALKKREAQMKDVRADLEGRQL